MTERNQTSVSEFILVGLTDDPVLQSVLFVLFLGFYVVTLLGNFGMILLIRIDSRLHTPMYFFLRHLSFIDLCSSSSISPKMLSDLLMERKVITFARCAAQFFFFAAFGTTECFLLAAMAYDRYMAICKPLHYSVSMSYSLCIRMVVGSYAAGTLNAMVHTGTIFQLSFCGPNIINHYYCEEPPVLELACSDTSINKIVVFVFVGFNMTVTSVTILVSYTYILFTILRISSAEGRHKAFSTCASHLTVITLYYGGAGFVYFQPSASHLLDQVKVASVFYTVVTPMLNPMIYSLRNKEVKAALRKAMMRKPFSPHI
ncbi:olfactory receptor 1009-like [Hemicordylus capensis]|uniref:olfactory receptor 1009-like n=1 Tax=Hemicordylus capensis TaxID=884348 RepID=UPI002303838C|nr:olfactory receptor 1009-like [Hemicordylus capensis]XP_053139902.1 olfactory receptor 1009-like [Hemicordylus capensis]XP_053139903.1 olfactory receptor 1009-like [Hemicordylus capensis]